MVGKPSRKSVAQFIADNKVAKNIDVVIANSDNLAHGRGVTRKTVEEVLTAGVDILTCGDHAWDNPQAFDILRAEDLNFLCPANLPDMDPRLSAKIFTIKGIDIMVMNLMGVVFMDRGASSPFVVADMLLKENEENKHAKIIILDFHAEATSEKKAMGAYLSGRVSAVLGTHTHIQTADEDVMSSGTAYITDAGMVSVKNSILGCEESAVLDQFINQTAFKYKPAEDDKVLLEGVIIDIDEKSGKATKIERIREEVLIDN
jgi:metallophosphoesterase (TIGR00282 family)